MSAAVLADSQSLGPREQACRALETIAPSNRGLRLHTRRTTADTGTVRTTVHSRATVRMARTIGRATAAVRLPATLARAQVKTVRLRATVAQRRTMAAEAIAVQLRATAVQLLAMAADRTAGRHRATTVDLLAARCLRMVAAPMDGQLRPTVAEDGRWVLTAVEAVPTVVGEGMLPRRAAVDTAVEVAEVVTAIGKLQI